MEVKYVKSSASGPPNTNCVEAGWDPERELIAVRHSQRTAAAPLPLSADEWSAFLVGVQAGIQIPIAWTGAGLKPPGPPMTGL